MDRRKAHGIYRGREDPVEIQTVGTGCQKETKRDKDGKIGRKKSPNVQSVRTRTGERSWIHVLTLRQQQKTMEGKEIVTFFMGRNGEAQLRDFYVNRRPRRIGWEPAASEGWSHAPAKACWPSAAGSERFRSGKC